MIAKITRGRDTAKLLAYLYGPGRANEHADPHLVASWDGLTPDPGRHPNAKIARAQLARAIDLRVTQAGARAPVQHVWHCSLRAAPEDRRLADDEWAAIARRVLHATGIAPHDDPDACRWVAVRHADDHIHIAATLVRGDLRTARHWNDYLRADRELASVERDYGLHQVVRGDRTAARRPTRAEAEKARRTGRSQTPRERLRTTVRQVVSAATSTEEFLHLLSALDGIRVEVQHFPSGDPRGYKIALVDDINAIGEPVWFSGSTLAPDLSLPKIRERLTAIEHPPVTAPGNRSKSDPWLRATAAAEGVHHHLDQGDDATAQAHIAAFGEAIDLLPLIAPHDMRPHLRQAATAFERATRSRVRAEQNQARALRRALRALRTAPHAKNGSGLAMFLDIAVLVVIAAVRWHQVHRHDQQAAAARQALLHLQAAGQLAVAQPLAALTQRRPPAHTVEQQAARLRAALPHHADRLLADPAWPALATALTEAENTGHDPVQLLRHATRRRTPDNTPPMASTFIWRIQRLAARQVPNDRAQAAGTHTTTSPQPARASDDPPVSAHSTPPTSVRRR